MSLNAETPSSGVATSMPLPLDHMGFGQAHVDGAAYISAGMAQLRVGQQLVPPKYSSGALDQHHQQHQHQHQQQQAYPYLQQAGPAASWPGQQSGADFGAAQGGRGGSGGSTSNRLKMVLEMLLPCNIISLFPETHQAQMRSLISAQLLSSLANLAGFYCLSACAACEVRFSGTFLERVASKAAHYASAQHYACVRDFLAHGQVGGPARSSAPGA
jgi:hypothetical protein